MAYEDEDIFEAVKNSLGIISTVARRLGCTRNTIYAWKKERPEIRAALRDETECWLDKSEVELARKISEGSLDAIKFHLKTRGKNRGYSERQEITGAEGEPVTVKIIRGISLDDL